MGAQNSPATSRAPRGVLETQTVLYVLRHQAPSRLTPAEISDNPLPVPSPLFPRGSLRNPLPWPAHLGQRRTQNSLPTSIQPSHPAVGGRVFIDPPPLQQSSPTTGSQQPRSAPPSALASYPTSPPPLPPSFLPLGWRVHH
ncbi:hypothetical protein P7K49_033570 [Saguinus oedipus]|uniref:Uncharacterized protein n=1 Tax=Saguinus oedipus TaxID=9490 RepID=A0ABQ9TSA7_SAGOE|nr:hypothetical protein P7K49_033570 [Saguinus oedipus]